MSEKRLFFALWPDPRQRDRLRDLLAPAAKQIEGRAVFRGDWHVTLKFIGPFAERRVPALLERAAEVPVEPFRTRFDRVEFWPRAKVARAVCPAVPAELERLVTALDSLAGDFDVAPEERRFRPHITVVRRARPFETQRLAQPAVVDWSGFELIESIGGPDGSSYQPLKQ